MFLLQSPADSALAGEIGSALGNQATILILAGLGFVTKIIVSLVGKLLPKWDGLNDLVKAVVAMVFAQVVAFVNSKFGFAISPDITALGTSAAGMVTWLIAMGWHRLGKFLPWDPTKPAEPAEPTP